MDRWLKCSISPGMLPGEFAVEVGTVNAGKVSLFAHAGKVRADENLVLVETFGDPEGEEILVRLPAPPFEISGQNVRVPLGAIMQEVKKEAG